MMLMIFSNVGNFVALRNDWPSAEKRPRVENRVCGRERRAEGFIVEFTMIYAILTGDPRGVLDGSLSCACFVFRSCTLSVERALVYVWHQD